MNCGRYERIGKEGIGINNASEIDIDLLIGIAFVMKFLQHLS
jgi:hypothetical protein